MPGVRDRGGAPGLASRFTGAVGRSMVNSTGRSPMAPQAVIERREESCRAAATPTVGSADDRIERRITDPQR
jgi:hypothetical protein